MIPDLFKLGRIKQTGKAVSGSKTSASPEGYFQVIIAMMRDGKESW